MARPGRARRGRTAAAMLLLIGLAGMEAGASPAASVTVSGAVPTRAADREGVRVVPSSWRRVSEPAVSPASVAPGGTVQVSARLPRPARRVAVLQVGAPGAWAAHTRSTTRRGYVAFDLVPEQSTQVRIVAPRVRTSRGTAPAVQTPAAMVTVTGEEPRGREGISLEILGPLQQDRPGRFSMGLPVEIRRGWVSVQRFFPGADSGSARWGILSYQPFTASDIRMSVQIEDLDEVGYTLFRTAVFDDEGTLLAGSDPVLRQVAASVGGIPQGFGRGFLTADGTELLGEIQGATGIGGDTNPSFVLAAQAADRSSLPRHVIERPVEDVSGSGRYVLYRAEDSPPPCGQPVLRLLDRESGVDTEVRTAPEDPRQCHAAPSVADDGSVFFSSFSADSAVPLGARTYRLAPRASVAEPFRSGDGGTVRLSDDGTRVAFASYHFEENNFDWRVETVATPGVVGRLPRVPGALMHLTDLSADGRTGLATATYEDDTHDLLLWSVDDGTLTTVASRQRLSTLVISGDGRTVAWQRSNGEILHWRDGRTGQLVVPDPGFCEEPVLFDLDFTGAAVAYLLFWLSYDEDCRRVLPDRAEHLVLRLP